VLDDAVTVEWAAAVTGSPVSEVLFTAGHLSRVIGVRLADGREVVLKNRPYRERLHGCVRVQSHLAADGFPCPRPLAGPDEVNDRALSVESMLAGGEQLAVGSGAAPFAALLAELVERAPPAGAVPPLDPAPPWAAWDHADPGLWPAADDYGRDLNLSAGPAWLDTAGRAVRQRLAHAAAERRIGHGDWESQNLRWAPDGTPVAVHDWDSVVAQPEAAIAGMAAAVWPRRGGPADAATVDESDAFLRAYVAARRMPWSNDDEEVAWAAGLWVRLFDAKQEAADGSGPLLEGIEAELAVRSRQAGIKL
jgi:hypothetical protein